MSLGRLPPDASPGRAECPAALPSASRPIDGRWILALCLLSAGSAGLAARWFVSDRRDRWFASLVLTGLSLPLAWWAARMALGAERLAAWFGPPVTGWPEELAYLLRFAVVYCVAWTTCCLAGMVALMLAEPRAQPRR